MINKYVEYLKGKVESQAAVHNREEETDHSNSELKTLTPLTIRKPTFVSRYSALNACLQKANSYEPIDLDDFVPMHLREKRYYIDELKRGIEVPIVLFRVPYRTNSGKINCVGKTINDESQLIDNCKVINSIYAELPVYHSRKMKRAFISKCSLTTPSVKPAVLRTIYTTLTRDASAAESSDQAMIDKRVKQAFEMEDPDILMDYRPPGYRAHNVGRPSKYDALFNEAEKYLEHVVEILSIGSVQDIVNRFSVLQLL